MAGHKQLTIEFYQANIEPDGQFERVADIFEAFPGAFAREAVIQSGGENTYELKPRARSGKRFRAVFAKYRNADLPHAGVPGGRERELELAENEEVLEKNYLHFLPEHDLLVYQRNHYGSGPGRLARYMTQLADGQAVTFDVVLQADTMKRLMSGGVHLRRVELSVARPTNAGMHASHDFSRRVLEMLETAGGYRLSTVIRSRSRSFNADRFLLQDVKRGISDLLNVADVRKAKVIADDGETVYPIDLVADRIYSEQQVAMNGRYPDERSIDSALEKAYAECRGQLEEILGSNAKRLG